MDASPLLKVASLVAGYQDRKIIDGISFGVPRGCFLGIIGPNGSGKTTLFRVITGFLKPWEGEVLYQGKNTSRIPASDIAKEIAVMPQGLESTFSFSVEELVAMGRFPHLGRLQKLGKRDRDVIRQVLELTDTEDFKDKKLFELSGGERQRVFLAQSLAQEPKLLLLDEPTAHLDIGHQIRILDVIKRLNRTEGMTVIVVLHDLNLASLYCDQLILLKDGFIFKEGSPSEVMTYETIEAVYETVVLVNENPVTKRPHVLLVSREQQ
ncbi:MAG: ABC transporter ATP-binding protein [Deltaproteobacteria bacterium]|nr:ABC transporter ATP-binding protein [Deltaproteobacteria bacterium]